MGPTGEPLKVVCRIRMHSRLFWPLKCFQLEILLETKIFFCIQSTLTEDLKNIFSLHVLTDYVVAQAAGGL